jgi:DNA-binding NarL/FixJ family response regulator
MLMPGLRVLLAGDCPLVRAGLRALLAPQPDVDVVGEAADAAAALRAARALRPDVAVVDLSGAGPDGAGLPARLRQECPALKVLVLTPRGDRGSIRQVLRAGACGCVLKRAAAEELIQAIRVVARGGVYLAPPLAGQIMGGLVERSAADGAGGAELSAREAEVLRRIAVGLSNKEVAAPLGISVKTVETYKARSMQKLGLRNRTDIVRYALRRGWLQEL